MISREEVLQSIARIEYGLVTKNDGDTFKANMDCIKQYLTQSPTSEEVCKAFKVWYEKKNCELNSVDYNKEDKTFSYTWLYDNKPMMFTICKMDYGVIEFITNVPPHLITMIGKFYEGSESE